MKSFVKTISQFTLLLFISGLFFALPSEAGRFDSVNGSWQYLVRRGDSKGLGKFGNRNCPFYVGYFNLDIRRELKPDSKGRRVLDLRNGEFQAVKGSGSKRFVIGNNSYEMKGSYTPYDTNKYCKSPLTKINNEKAPLYMTKITPNLKKLEWYVDFAEGSKRQNAIWMVSASFDGKETIRGKLKAYVCAGDGRTNCDLINTTKFTAKKIKSIQEASGQPLFSKQLTPFERAINSVLPNFYNTGGVFQDKYIYPETELENVISKEYVRPNIGAVLPAWSANIGLQICQSRGGTTTGSGVGVRCEICEPVDCADGQEPTTKEQGVCYGNNDGSSVCQCECGNCLGHTLTGNCQSL